MSIYLNVFVHVSTLFLLHLLMTGGGQSPGRPFQVSVASVRSSLGTAVVNIVTSDQTCGCLMSVIQSPDMKAMFEDLTLIVLQYQYTQGQQNLYQ